jgi:biotin carboxyl carrier protein
MPGKVVRVLASKGDLVEKGQGLIVVEAMKMQNEVRAPRSGRLISIAVRAGDTVTAGQTLASVE